MTDATSSNAAGSSGVAGDVEAIFAPLRASQATAMPPSPPPQAGAGVQAQVRDPRQGHVAPRLGALVAGLVVAVTVGAVWIKPVLDEQSRAAAAAALLASTPAGVANESSTPPSRPSRIPEIPTAFTYTPPAQVISASAPSATAPAKARETTAKGSSRCRELSGQRRRACFHAQVMSADRRLRRAYARAGDAGVSRPVMIAYRNRWAGLRRQAIHNPGRVVAGYGAMATELGREARNAERRYGTATG